MANEQPKPDVSDAWDVAQYTDQRGDVGHEKATLEHERTGVSIFVRELPSGAALQLRVPANLPGGFKGVHESKYHDNDHAEPFAAAIKEAERRAAQYDGQGTWYVEGAPVLH